MRYTIVALVFLIVVLAEICFAAPPEGKGKGSGKDSEGGGGQGKGKGKGKEKGNRLNDTEIQAIKEACKKTGKSCKGQSDKAKGKRKKVKDGLLEQVKHRKPGTSDADAAKEVETRLNKIHAIKKKLNEVNGLTDIDPSDDGSYQKDLLLNNDQADFILQNLENPGDVPDPTSARAKRSAATYFERWPTYRWVTPIRYWVSSTGFLSSERATIDSALSTLASSIGCIKFTKDTSRSTTGPQIQYTKSSSEGCAGVSEVGYQSDTGINHVQLDIEGWCSGDILKSIVMHETIHSLGGGHEQSRPDRDKYIDITWNNIDPQEFPQYAKDSYATTYGVPYDYKSVMHYEQGTFAVKDGLSTMVPKTSTTLSGNYLTNSDILQLKRMYCKSSSCKDVDVNCGYWASVNNYCTTTYVSYMKTNCPKSCGYC